MSLHNIVTRLRALNPFSRPPTPASAAYYYQPTPAAQTYEEAVQVLAGKGLDVRRGQVATLDDAGMDQVAARLRALGVEVRDWVVDAAQFQDYMQRAGYLGEHSAYYSDNRNEKALEHFVAFKELGLAPGQVAVDVASEHSPVPQMYAKLAGADCYAQDIQYAAGINGRKIGGDACAMPVPDGFASAATLTCSIEHFEGDGDTRLMKEMARVLKRGGKLVVAPLYMSTEAATQTDPLYSAATDVPFDTGNPVYCKEAWGNRHGRFYSPRTLVERLVAPNRESLSFTVGRIANLAGLPANTYLRFFLVVTRR